MALMKAQQATPALKEAVVLDLGDIGAQAAKIRAQAEAKAAEIVADAERKAAEITAGAEQRGHDEGRQKGYDQGLEEGRRAGHDEAFAAMQDQLQQLTTAWHDVAGQWDAQRQDMDREARQAVLEFALRMAEKLIHRAIEVDPTVVVDQLAQALSHVLRPLDVTVRAHPDDVPLLEEALPDLIAEFSHLQHVQLHRDAEVSRGGCIVSFGQGRIDATIETQLERVIDTILPLESGEKSDRVIEGSSDPENPSPGAS